MFKYSKLKNLPKNVRYVIVSYKDVRAPVNEFIIEEYDNLNIHPVRAAYKDNMRIFYYFLVNSFKPY